MPRLRLDPTSPSGISIAPDAPARSRQGHGYISNKATGLIKAGTNVTLTGSGVSNDPYIIAATGGGTGGTNATNLSTTQTTTSVTINSDTGTGATIPTASGTAAGVFSSADKTKLDAVTGTNTGDQTITLTGDVTGTGTGSFATTLKDTIGSSGTTGNSGTVIPVITYDSKGRITAISTTAVATPTTISGSITESQVTNLTTDLAGKQATLTLTTTGTSGAATLSSGTLNIPQYSGGSGGSGITWNEVTATTQTAVINTGYIANNAAQVVITLPSTAAQGSIIEVAGKGAGGWKVAQNASQLINFGRTVTTTGTGGSLASTNQYDTIRLLCTTANTGWLVLSSVGNISVT